VKSGHFREDLLHRLNVIRIEIPPLRERREDIPELLRHYLSVAGQELGVEPKLLTSSAETALVTFDWPGNVRQLVNACRRLTVTAPGARFAPRTSRRISAAYRPAAPRIMTGWPSFRIGPNRNWMPARSGCWIRRCRKWSAS
jgi:DNA-binding NtrC family response regulator